MNWETADSLAFSKIFYHGMTKREAEMAFFLDKLWPPSPETDVEFVDVTHTIVRITSGRVDADAFEAYDSKSPWRSDTPTHVLIRHKLVGEELALYMPRSHCCRMIEPLENMRMFGLDDSFWSQGTVISELQADTDVAEHRRKL